MHRRTLRAAALLAFAVVLAACSAGAPADGPLAGDSERVRLLGGLPPEEAGRGVYVVDLEAAAGEMSPGSRVGPFLGAVLNEAELLVETTAPPVTLLGGVDEDVPTPEHALRVGTTLVFAEPEIGEAVAERLRNGEEPVPALAAAGESTAPVVWLGPTPAPDAGGTTLVELDESNVTFTLTPSTSVETASEHVRTQLADGGPPGSPGKKWNTILGEAEIAIDGDQVTVTAVPVDLPGPLLRSLLDQQQLTFLTG